MAKIMSRGENYVVTDFPAPSVNLEEYAMQIISIPQFQNFTLKEEYIGTQKFNGKVGGVFALAASNLFEINEGNLNVENKGGAPSYGSEGLDLWATPAEVFLFLQKISSLVPTRGSVR